MGWTAPPPSQTNGSSSLLAKGDADKLQKLAHDFRRDVGIKDRKYHQKTYKECFVGTEAVDYLVASGAAVDRTDAVNIGRVLAEEFHLFEHVTSDHQFKDESFFYCFSKYDAGHDASLDQEQAWVKEGPLVKLAMQGQGPFQRIAVSYLGLRRWKRHWVRVRTGQLIYQLDESNPAQRRAIDLVSLGTTVRATHKRPFSFTVDFQSRNGGCLHLHMQANDAKERNEWIDAIRSCIPSPWSAGGGVSKYNQEGTDSEIIDELLGGTALELEDARRRVSSVGSPSLLPEMVSDKSSVSEQFEKVGTKIRRMYEATIDIEAIVQQRHVEIEDIKSYNEEISDEINSWWTHSEQETAGHAQQMAESQYRIAYMAQQLFHLQQENASLCVTTTTTEGPPPPLAPSHLHGQPPHQYHQQAMTSVPSIPPQQPQDGPPADVPADTLTAVPTAQPTGQGLHALVAGPITALSAGPTSAPTVSPRNPSLSAGPTDAPTAVPSGLPTAAKKLTALQPSPSHQGGVPPQHQQHCSTWSDDNLVQSLHHQAFRHRGFSDSESDGDASFDSLPPHQGAPQQQQEQPLLGHHKGEQPQSSHQHDQTQQQQSHPQPTAPPSPKWVVRRGRKESGNKEGLKERGGEKEAKGRLEESAAKSNAIDNSPQPLVNHC